jgi:Tfp pilus assembly protein PilO
VKNRRYALFAFVLVATVFIFQYAFLIPQAETMKESIETKYKTLLKDRQFIGSAGMTAANMNSLINETKGIEDRVIQEKSDFLASAKLQGEVSGIARQSGLNVTTIRPVPTVKLGKYIVVSVYFEGSGDIKQMSGLLKGIEDDKLLIKVSKLGINITNMQNPKDLKYKIQVAALAKL